MPKYESFIHTFPSIDKLARAPQSKIFRLWQGLGYNRRALFLRDAAREIVERYGGEIPHTPDRLCTLPGIGPATAASIAAFAFNYPAVFIETNIRTVFIHHFFSRRRGSVHDDTIVPLAQQCLDRRNPRKWYSALMDYGAYLKKKAANPSRKSVHYKRQAAFSGSTRQVRGNVLRMVLTHGPQRAQTLYAKCGDDRQRVKSVVDQLVREGFLKKRNARFFLDDR
jgi:A/G-specific adenine glycosylase